MRKRQIQLRDHVVNCGFGCSGCRAAAGFARRGGSGGNIVVSHAKQSAITDG